MHKHCKKGEKPTYCFGTGDENQKKSRILESIEAGETLNFLTLFSDVLLPQPSHGPSFETASEKRNYNLRPQANQLSEKAREVQQ